MPKSRGRGEMRGRGGSGAARGRGAPGRGGEEKPLFFCTVSVSVY